jgi:CHASE2 domain-containing sensor protein
MSGFFSSMFAEISARRRRLRASLGDRGQGVAEFLVLAGLGVGSVGLFVREWMPGAAPWGFALPFVFLIGYGFIDYRRQAAIRVAEAKLAEMAERARVVARRECSDMPEVADEDGRTIVDRTRQNFDWIALLWSFGCALAGAAAFAIAWSAEPPAPPQEEIWTPPENSVPVDISP